MLDELLAVLGLDTFQHSVKGQMLFNCHVVKEHVFLWAEPNQLPSFAEFAANFEATNTDFPRGRLNFVRKGSESRGFSGTVDTQQDKALAKTCAERCVFDCECSLAPLGVHFPKFLHFYLQKFFVQTFDPLLFGLHVVVFKVVDSLEALLA